MTIPKNLGIWMDHSNANLMEFTTDIKTNIIASEFTRDVKANSLEKGENLMHNKQQHQRSEYYKRLSEVIRNYEEVVLFGPTTAKNELANLLKDDHHFEKVKVVVKHADKMTENQQHAFVRKHFEKG